MLPTYNGTGGGGADAGVRDGYRSGGGAAEEGGASVKERCGTSGSGFDPGRDTQELAAVIISQISPQVRCSRARGVADSGRSGISEKEIEGGVRAVWLYRARLCLRLAFACAVAVCAGLGMV
jgi:hypothetical protein